MQEAYAEDTLAPPAASSADPPCLNCGTPVPLAYCGACGQPAATGRLTMRQLFADAASGFLKIERRAVQTTHDLLVRPGPFLLAYLGGKRAPYAGPVQYLLLTLAAALVLGVLLDLSPIAERFRDPLLRDAGWWSRFPTATLFLALALPSIPAAWVYGWLRPKTRLTVAERLVVILYADGLALLAWVLIEVPLGLAVGSVSFMDAQLVLSIAFMVAWAWIAPRVFRETAWGVTWRISLAMVIVMVLAGLLGLMLGVAVGLAAG